MIRQIRLTLDKYNYERGETTAQAVLAVPVLLLFLLFGVQVALYFHTAQLASFAAQEAASVGASHDGNEAMALARAIQWIAESRAISTRLPIIDVADGSFQVSVGLHVPQIIPLLPDHVVRSASEPIETYILESDR